MRNEDHSQPVYPDYIHFYHTFRPNPDGSNSVFQVGVSPGPILWLKARDLEVPEEIMADILDLPEITVFKHAGFRYVSMNAVIETCPALDTARIVRLWVDEMLQEILTTDFSKAPSHVAARAESQTGSVPAVEPSAKLAQSVPPDASACAIQISSGTKAPAPDSQP